MPSPRKRTASETRLFQFPGEGSYLEEALDNKRNPLINEDWEDRDAGSNAVPVRLLHDFVCFDPKTLQLVPLSCLYDGVGFCEAFGRASPTSEDQEEQKAWSNDRIQLRLSNIFKWSLDLEKENIWILTQFAWYILKTPTPEYKPFFVPFYKKEMILRLVLRHLSEDPTLSLHEFFELLSLKPDPLLNRCWTEDDVTSNFNYSRKQLRNIIEDFPSISWADIKDLPLIRDLLHEPRVLSQRSRNKEIDSLSPDHNSSTQTRSAASKSKLVTTALSHIVHSLISPFYDVKFTVVGQKPEFLENIIMLSRENPPHEVDYDFIGSLKPGDFVLVNESDHSDDSHIQFAQIVFLDSRGKKFHARWFIHGSKTILEDVAFGQELFLSVADHCRDVTVDCVVGRCEVFHISLQDRSKLCWPANDAYFFSSAWDRNNPVDFIEIQQHQVEIPPSRYCPRCDSEKSALPLYRQSRSGVIINQEEFHTHDFIRYQETASNQLNCSFGQIIAFNHFGKGLEIKVCRLGRICDRKDNKISTENELFMTHMEVDVNPERVLGKCQVTHISQYEDRLTDFEWLDRHMSRFYIQYQAKFLHTPLIPFPLTDLRVCDHCEKQQRELDDLDLACREDISLRAFDPFCGVGGFGLGLGRECSMHTTYGVDVDPSAVETMRQNFPLGTKVIHADASQILQRVAHRQADGNVPQPGEIDLIYSGPPCQNDSTLNMHKNDKRCLAFTALSFLDILEAQIFIMEAVPGFLHRNAQGSTGEIKSGDLKLVVKVLHFLGYNVVGRLLHARSFGDPQTRTRFFIIATRPEYGEFPSPEATHVFKEEKPRYPGYVANLGPGFKLKAVAARNGCGLHELITVSGAISDLPLFDWENPEQTSPITESITTVSCGKDEEWGIPDASFQYTSPPVNNFQHRARRNLGLTDPNYQHYTKHFDFNVIKNVCNVPMWGGADYRHLDQKNREWSLRDPTSAKAIRGYIGGAYTRLDPDGYFRTIVTNVGPVAKQSHVLHPLCKRILTVRELARAQGFPDDFIFYSEDNKIDDYHRQIGNSVPFGMSAALGRSIQKMVFRKWKRDNARN